MKLMIYGIGGRLEAGASGDCHVGTAHDVQEVISLLNIVKTNGGYAVSLHGKIDSRAEDISGEMSLPEAYNLFSREASYYHNKWLQDWH